MRDWRRRRAGRRTRDAVARLGRTSRPRSPTSPQAGHCSTAGRRERRRHRRARRGSPSLPIQVSAGASACGPRPAAGRGRVRTAPASLPAAGRARAAVELLVLAAQGHGGPGAKQTLGVLAGLIDLEAVRVMLDHGDGQPPRHELGNGGFKQGGFAGAGESADRQHGRAKFEIARIVCFRHWIPAPHHRRRKHSQKDCTSGSGRGGRAWHRPGHGRADASAADQVHGAAALHGLGGRLPAM